MSAEVTWVAETVIMLFIAQFGSEGLAAKNTEIVSGAFVT